MCQAQFQALKKPQGPCFYGAYIIGGDEDRQQTSKNKLVLKKHQSDEYYVEYYLQIR